MYKHTTLDRYFTTTTSAGNTSKSNSNNNNNSSTSNKSSNCIPRKKQKTLSSGTSSSSRSNCSNDSTVITTSTGTTVTTDVATSIVPTSSLSSSTIDVVTLDHDDDNNNSNSNIDGDIFHVTSSSSSLSTTTTTIVVRNEHENQYSNSTTATATATATAATTMIDTTNYETSATNLCKKDDHDCISTMAVRMNTNKKNRHCNIVDALYIRSSSSSRRRSSSSYGRSASTMSRSRSTSSTGTCTTNNNILLPWCIPSYIQFPFPQLGDLYNSNNNNNNNNTIASSTNYFNMNTTTTSSPTMMMMKMMVTNIIYDPIHERIVAIVYKNHGNSSCNSNSSTYTSTSAGTAYVAFYQWDTIVHATIQGRRHIQRQMMNSTTITKAMTENTITSSSSSSSSSNDTFENTNRTTTTNSNNNDTMKNDHINISNLLISIVPDFIFPLCINSNNNSSGSSFHNNNNIPIFELDPITYNYLSIGYQHDTCIYIYHIPSIYEYMKVVTTNATTTETTTDSTNRTTTETARTRSVHDVAYSIQQQCCPIILHMSKTVPTTTSNNNVNNNNNTQPFTFHHTSSSRNNNNNISFGNVKLYEQSKICWIPQARQQETHNNGIVSRSNYHPNNMHFTITVSTRKVVMGWNIKLLTATNGCDNNYINSIQKFIPYYWQYESPQHTIISTMNTLPSSIDTIVLGTSTGQFIILNYHLLYYPSMSCTKCPTVLDEWLSYSRTTTASTNKQSTTSCKINDWLQQERRQQQKQTVRNKVSNNYYGSPGLGIRSLRIVPEMYIPSSSTSSSNATNSNRNSAGNTKSESHSTNVRYRFIWITNNGWILSTHIEGVTAKKSTSIPTTISNVNSTSIVQIRRRSKSPYHDGLCHVHYTTPTIVYVNNINDGKTTSSTTTDIQPPYPMWKEMLYYQSFPISFSSSNEIIWYNPIDQDQQNIQPLPVLPNPDQRVLSNVSLNSTTCSTLNSLSANAVQGTKQKKRSRRVVPKLNYMNLDNIISNQLLEYNNDVDEYNDGKVVECIERNQSDSKDEKVVNLLLKNVDKDHTKTTTSKIRIRTSQYQQHPTCIWIHPTQPEYILIGTAEFGLYLIESRSKIT